MCVKRYASLFAALKLVQAHPMMCAVQRCEALSSPTNDSAHDAALKVAMRCAGCEAMCSRARSPWCRDAAASSHASSPSWPSIG
jgi:hypothetical protein